VKYIRVKRRIYENADYVVVYLRTAVAKSPAYFHFSTSDFPDFLLSRFTLSYTLMVIYERVSDVKALIACNLYA